MSLIWVFGLKHLRKRTNVRLGNEKAHVNTLDTNITLTWHGDKKTHLMTGKLFLPVVLVVHFDPPGHLGLHVSVSWLQSA